MPAPRRSISLAALVIPPGMLVASVVVLVIGIAMTIAENDALVAALNSPEGTAAAVYGGQSRVVVAAAVLTAGILAVVVSLATIAITGSIRAFAPRFETAASVTTDADDVDDFGDLDDLDEMRGVDDEADAAHDESVAEPVEDGRDVTPGASSPAR
ncbi:hypothetical protein [Agromyces binzhouensis]|uniref:hypothetical protein n=1 Tax=Agromyces binzhouensis TaxID=1817495 RepID=UPI0036429546